MSIQILIGALLIGDVPHRKNSVYGGTIVEDGNRLSVLRDGLTTTPPIAHTPVSIALSAPASHAWQPISTANLTEFSQIARSRMAAPVHCRHAVRHTMMPPGI